MLEVVDRGSCAGAHPSPLLFIHGSWHAAWCWDDHFLDFFADRGYRAMAVSLRGHGASPSPKPLRFCSIADYVADVVSVAAGLPGRPVLIGHSLGGYVVQKYLVSHDAPAGVLVASMPPRGVAGFTMRLTRRQPWRTARAMITGDSLQLFDDAERAREYFFSPGTPDDVVQRCVARLGQESQRVTFDALGLDLPEPDLVSAPLLVLGGEHDGCFTTEDVRETARAYRTTADIVPGVGHDMMLEPTWRDVAERIDRWLVGRGL